MTVSILLYTTLHYMTLHTLQQIHTIQLNYTHTNNIHVTIHTSSIASLATFTSSSFTNNFYSIILIATSLHETFSITSAFPTSSGRHSPGNLALLAASSSLARVTSSGSSSTSSAFFFPVVTNWLSYSLPSGSEDQTIQECPENTTVFMCMH